jgi:hypothetical protein
VNARVAAGFFFVLVIGAVSAAPVANAIMSKVAPLVAWDIECSHGNGRACYAVGKKDAGIAADLKACRTNSYEERPCERLLERDADHADQYCAQWRAECGPSQIYGKCSVVTSGRCSATPAAPMDSILDY